MAKARAAAKKTSASKAKSVSKVSRTRTGRRVDLAIAVRAAPERVWLALTSPAGLASWYVREAKLEPQTGGGYHFVWGNATTRGDVLAAEENRRIELSWHHDTRVSIRLARRHRGRETVVSLRHAGIPAALGSVELYAQLRQSWTFSLVNLKSVLEQGTDLRDPDPRRTFAKGWANCWD